MGLLVDTYYNITSVTIKRRHICYCIQKQMCLRFIVTDVSWGMLLFATNLQYSSKNQYKIQTCLHIVAVTSKENSVNLEFLMSVSQLKVSTDQPSRVLSADYWVDRIILSLSGYFSVYSMYSVVPYCWVNK